MENAHPPDPDVHNARGGACPTVPGTASRRGTLADRFLDGLADAIRDRRMPGSFARRAVRALRMLLTAVTLCYVAGLAFTLLFLDRWAELHWLSWMLLYVPPQTFLLPLAALLPPALLIHRRLLIPQLLCIPAVLIFHMGFRWSFGANADDGDLTILSNNIGQKNGQRLSPYVEKVAPDIIALQEGSPRGPAYARQYPDMQVAYTGEFILISRYPIRSKEIVRAGKADGYAVAARFVVETPVGPVAVYNVHLPSPRRELDRLRGRGALYELARDFGIGPSREDSARAALQRRLAAADGLYEHLQNEEYPLVATGDFNFPGRGRLYRRFSSLLRDAFREKGRGYGYTFPGTTRNPLSLFGPWLRLDYVFTSKDLEIRNAMAEPRRKSQHRAVAATVRLRSGGP